MSSAERSRFVPYPPIERHGVIGDRRTAAVVAADGTVDWLCLPDFDGTPVCGALVDARRGGWFRFGPRLPWMGRQRYVDDTAILETRWQLAEGELELVDFMPWPGETRPPHQERQRALIRRLRCLRGEVACALGFEPRLDFGDPPRDVHLDTSFPRDGNHVHLTLRAGDEAWAALRYGSDAPWTAAMAAQALAETAQHWREWCAKLPVEGVPRDQIMRSAIMVHLLGYAPDGSMVAAATSSLPERLCGDRNYDYRFAWIRDASLSLAGFAALGDTETSERFLGWLCGLGSHTDAPLQVCYGVRGEQKLGPQERPHLDGYRGTKPVRFGNRAHKQRQIGSLGYLMDAVYNYVERDGRWCREYGELMTRVADYVASQWRRPDSGVWELEPHQEFVSSRVMAWVALDRALNVAERHPFGTAESRQRWRAQRDAIFAEVMRRGFNERRRAFVETYGSETLDSAALLIGMMGFLPADDPRFLSTVERLKEELTIDGFLYRWDPSQQSHRAPPLGEFEGAFLPLMFWLASAMARAGRFEEAEEALARGGVGGE